MMKQDNAAATTTECPTEACIEQSGDKDRSGIGDWDDDPPPLKNGPSPWLLAQWLLVGVLAFTAPTLERVVAGLGKPRTPLFLGPVAQVRFTGSWAPRTQVDVAIAPGPGQASATIRSLLLQGSVSLSSGDELEQRNTFWGPQVCRRGSDACWDLLSQ